MACDEMNKVVADGWDDAASLWIEERDRPLRQFTDWKCAESEGYNSKTNFKYDHGLTLKPGERLKAEYVERKVMTVQQWRAAKERYNRQCDELKKVPEHRNRLERLQSHIAQLRVSRRPDDRIEVITKAIPLYHVSQTRPGNFRERTKAMIRFGNIFWRPSNRSSYIQRNLEPDKYNHKWFTKDINQSRFTSEPFDFLNEGKLLDHIAQRQIYGVKANQRKPQWWYGADIDLHFSKGGSPTVFLRQVEAVLGHLQGKGWIVCLGMDVVDGVHVIKLLDEPKPLGEVRAMMQAVLREIADVHSDLEQDVVEPMKPISKAEVFPHHNQGFRLPLGRGYTALVDRPLELVHYHTHNGVRLHGADVVGLMTWDGSEMPLEEKLEYIRQRVPKDDDERAAQIEKTSDRYRATTTACDVAVAKALGDEKVLGSMKGRFRQVLVDFYSGRMQVTRSLQTGILLGVNALWAFDFPLEERGEYLLGLLQEIEITNPHFSSRLLNGEWEAILESIQQMIDASERLRSDAAASSGISDSNRTLRKWATAMRQGGFDFGNPATWSTCWSGTGDRDKLNVTLTNDEQKLIATEIAPVFACTPEVAVEAVMKMVTLAAIKDRCGDGMSREYRRALLTDLGINCQENSKLARCWEIVEEAGFIYLKHKHVFSAGRPGKGRACGYAVGPRVRDRVYVSHIAEQVTMPGWLEEAVAQPRLTTRNTASNRVEPDPEWECWTQAWLQREATA